MSCFDVTLKGYTQFCDMDDENAKPFNDEDYKKSEALVHWVQAPSKEAIDKFIEKHGLKECLDDIPYIVDGGHTVDCASLVINEEGDVITGSPTWKQEWTDQVQQFTEVLKA